MIAEFTAWLAAIFTAILGYLFTLIGDTFILFLKLVLFSISGLIMLIPAPCCVGGAGGGANVGSILSQFPTYLGYFFGMINISQFLTIVACGFVFRLARKICTLGQW